MKQTVRVIVVNADEEVAPELRAALLGVEGVRIVAEIDEPALLLQALDQFPAEVLLVHLDPNPAAMMDVVAPLLDARKGHLTAIGMTEDRDAGLVVRAMRAGMREFLWKPFPPEQLSEILQRVGYEAMTRQERLATSETARNQERREQHNQNSRQGPPGALAQSNLTRRELWPPPGR